ncbi:MAG: cytidine deaminase [Bacteroidia bacterium]|nr:cytidine deaminase [Bacteroidia bacterium]MBT8269079.1 cytidine deaminase [Bacteroidia bacterium]NNF81954.1 cytidine deaminase [Flavobacteriaceae bacterium]NNK69850.1 cytidine deaminase [Flavobacteriaceae bacterium]
MRKIERLSEFTVYNSIDELPSNINALMKKAIEARKNSYAPYSRFSVGAAVLMENGEVVTGSNQENASYPSGLCAERTAIYSAGSQFPGIALKTIAIVAGSKNKKTKKPIPPCGACRQAISEYELKQDSPISIFFMGEVGEVVQSDSLANLLPLLFDPSEL